MNPIAIFYHCRLHHAGTPPISMDHSIPIMVHQMRVIADSGLFSAASKFIIGTNGDSQNLAAVSMLAPPGTRVIDHGPDARSELPTLATLREWLPGHEDWIVFYHHSKCATRTDPLCVAWRGCMERHLIKEWQKCASVLSHPDSDVDSCGCHWMTPERWGASLLPTTTPYWGGNFWWATAKFLMTLPNLPANGRPGVRDDFWLAEKWIGLGPRRPQVRDFHPDWPNLKGCEKEMNR